MTSLEQRIPVHIVTGAPGSGKTGLIARLVGARADWLGLANSAPALPATNLKRLAAGCPCCTARVALQIGLARGLRESRATRAFVELVDARHAALLERVLGDAPLSRSVYLARTLALPADAQLSPFDLDA